MHELSVTKNIMEAVLAYAEGAGAVRVTEVVLRVGELNNLEAPWIQHYFDYLSKGTRAQGAHVVVRRIPIVVECDECGEETRITREQMAGFSCPACGSSSAQMVGGREMVIDRIEIEQ